MDFFADMTIIGKEDSLSINQIETGMYVKFSARRFSWKKGNQKIFFFQAWDEAAEKIKRLKLKPGSKCHIIANADNYIEQGKYVTYFKVMDIWISEAGSMIKKEKKEEEMTPSVQENKKEVSIDEILNLNLEETDLFHIGLPEDFKLENV